MTQMYYFIADRGRVIVDSAETEEDARRKIEKGIGLILIPTPSNEAYEEFRKLIKKSQR